MVDINLANFFTVGLIAIAFTALLGWIQTATGINIPFLPS